MLKKFLPIRQAILNKFKDTDLSKLDPDSIIEVDNILIMSTGKFQSANYGLIETTEQDLSNQEQAYKDYGNQFTPFVKIEHDGKEAVGELIGLNKSGQHLGADKVKIFAWVADKLKKGYLRGSSGEIQQDLYLQNGQVLPQSVRALALLGAKQPALWEKMTAYSLGNDTLELSYEKIINYEIIENEEIKKMPVEVSPEEVKMETKQEESMETSKLDKILELCEKMDSRISALESKNSMSEKTNVDYSLADNDKDKKTVFLSPEAQKLLQDSQDKIAQYALENDNAKKRLAQIEKERFEEKKELDKANNSAFVEGLIKDSKINPNLRKATLSLLNNAPKELVVNYSLGDQEVKGSFKQQLEGYFNALPVSKNSVVAGELAPSKSINGIEITQKDLVLYGMPEEDVAGEKETERRIEALAQQRGLDISNSDIGTANYRNLFHELQTS